MTSLGSTNQPRARVAVVGLCIAAVLAAIVLEVGGSDAYQTVLGISNPVTLTIVVATIGFATLRFVERSGFVATARSVRDGWIPAILIGCILPIPVIIVDMYGGFGPDINVTTPESLLFYPSIALMAEMVFHVVPLGLMAALAAPWKTAGRSLKIAGYGVAVMIEPALQVVWASGSSPTWAGAYVGFHLLAFNAVALFLMRRYGFPSAYVLRVSYYLVWHIIWGDLRLDLLFAS